MARACGPRGSTAEYLRNTVLSLEGPGIHDRNLWTLQRRVAQEIDAGCADQGSGSPEKAARPGWNCPREQASAGMIVAAVGAWPRAVLQDPAARALHPWLRHDVKLHGFFR